MSGISFWVKPRHLHFGQAEKAIAQQSGAPPGPQLYWVYRYTPMTGIWDVK